MTPQKDRHPDAAQAAEGAAPNKVTRFIWDGNTPLHEWKYEGQYPPATSILENELVEEKEPVENLITWVFEDGSFVPAAKLEGEEKYSVITDYLDTPTYS